MSTTLVGFVATALVVLIIPGPGVLYIVARSLSQGRRAGLVSVLGLSFGALIQVLLAALGLAAVLLTSATAFSMVKIVGAGYLIYLGIQALLEPHRKTGPGTNRQHHSSSRLFYDGVVVSLLNPKIALFLLAFLPQFVDPALAPMPLQILLLGMLYVLLALLTDSAYALLAARLRPFLGSRAVNGPWPHYGRGVIYLGLGVGTALTEPNASKP